MNGKFFGATTDSARIAPAFGRMTVLFRSVPPRLDRRVYSGMNWGVGQGGETMPIELHINGETKSVDVPADMPLLWVLRDVLGLTGTKFGCGVAQCGACTVHIDGKPVRSCLLAASSVGNRAVTTIEASAPRPTARKCRRRGSISK